MTSTYAIETARPGGHVPFPGSRAVMVAGHWEHWTLEAAQAEKARAREHYADRMARSDGADTLLSDWAASASLSRIEAIIQVLEKPNGTRPVPMHCGRDLTELRQRNWPHRTFYACRTCGERFGFMAIQPGHRRNAEVQWRTDAYARGVAATNNGYFCPASIDDARDTGPTMGQVLGWRERE